MTQVSFVSRLPANVTVQVFQAIGKGVTQRSAVVFRDGEQVGTLFTADTTNEVRELAAKFYVETYVDRIFDKRKAPKVWMVHTETGERLRVDPKDFNFYVDKGYKGGRDLAPAYLTNVRDPNAPHGLRGKHWFHLGTSRVRLNSDEVADYMARGYLPGRGKNTVYPEAVPAVDPTARCYNI